MSASPTKIDDGIRNYVAPEKAEALLFLKQSSFHTTIGMCEAYTTCDRVSSASLKVCC